MKNEGTVETARAAGGMQFRLEYKTGGFIKISAHAEEQMVFLANLGVKVLRGRNADALTRNDMAQWLGSSERLPPARKQYPWLRLMSGWGGQLPRRRGTP